MQLAFEEHSVSLQSWSDKRQMLEFLANCEAGMLLLGENDEQEIEFYSVVVHLETSITHRLGIGICSQGHGLIPYFLPQPEISTLIFGFNSEIIGIHISSGTIKFTLNLDSLFYSFLELYNQKMILVKHEIGVIALTQNGQVLWQFNQDIITNTFIKNNQLYIEFLDSPSVCLNLFDGTIVS